MSHFSAAKRRLYECMMRLVFELGGVWKSGSAAYVEKFGSSQPKPRARRRKHIADGPEGAASRGANKAKVDQVFALGSDLNATINITDELK